MLAAILFKVELGVRFGLTQKAVTSEACKWNQIFKKPVCRQMFLENVIMAHTPMVAVQKRQNMMICLLKHYLVVNNYQQFLFSTTCTTVQ